MSKSLESKMKKLRDKFLRNIDDFYKENKGEPIETVFAVLCGTIITILGGMDKNNKFKDELLNYSKKMMTESMILSEKIKRTIQ